MAKQSAMGAYSAMAGIGEVFADRGREVLEERDKAKKYFNELTKDESYTLTGKGYTRGMTIPQVRELFEYKNVKNKGTFSGSLAPQQLIDFYAKAIPELKGTQAGELTMGALDDLRQLYGIDAQTLRQISGFGQQTSERKASQSYKTKERDDQFVKDIITSYLTMSLEDKKRFEKEMPTLLDWAKAMHKGEDVPTPEIGKIPGYWAKKFPWLAKINVNVKPGVVPGTEVESGVTGRQETPQITEDEQAILDMLRKKGNTQLIRQKLESTQLAPPPAPAGQIAQDLGGQPAPGSPGLDSSGVKPFPQGSQSPANIGDYNPGKLEILSLLKNAKLHVNAKLP